MSLGSYSLVWARQRNPWDEGCESKSKNAMFSDTVDASEIRSTHQLRVGSLSHSLLDFIHPWRLLGISSINSKCMTFTNGKRYPAS